MTDKPTSWVIQGTTYRMGPGGIYAVPCPKGTTERWAVARMLQTMAEEALFDAISLHNPEEVVCPVCSTPAFRGMIPDGHGNTIPCWRCNLEEAKWAKALKLRTIPVEVGP